MDRATRPALMEKARQLKEQIAQGNKASCQLFETLWAQLTPAEKVLVGENLYHIALSEE